MAKRADSRMYEGISGHIDWNGATFFLPTTEDDRELIIRGWLEEWRKGLVHRIDLTGQTEIMVRWPSGSNRPRDYGQKLFDITFSVIDDGTLMIAVSGNQPVASVLRCLANDIPSDLDHH